MNKSNPKPEKKEKVEKLAEILSQAKSIVFIDYTGLTVKAQQALKKALKESGGSILVAKNTLISLAGKKAKLPESSINSSILSGQTAILVSKEDAITPIQVVGKFAQDAEIPKFKVGIIEGLFQDKDNLIRISKLPSKEVLMGQALAGVASPLYGLVNSLESNMQKLVFILSQKGGESQ